MKPLRVDGVSGGSSSGTPDAVMMHDAAGEVRPSSLAARIADGSSRGIAAEVHRLIRTGEIAPESRLPSVRALAVLLHVGPTTVAQAWATLRSQGVVRTSSRSGTFVASYDALPGARFLKAGSIPDVDLDLSRAVPDPRLLPDSESALVEAARTVDVGHYPEDPIDPLLAERLESSWPFSCSNFTITHSGLDAVCKALDVAVRPRDRVLIEETCAPELRDLVHMSGCLPVPMSCDDEGPVADDVRRLLALGPRLMLLQTRMANPTGHRLSFARATELARLLRDHPITIVEHDIDPALSLELPASLGAELPDRTLVARGWNRSHGPVLRVGALGGSGHLVNLVQSRQYLTSTWPSLVSQRALALLLEDPEACDTIRLAATTYAARRERLVDALSAHGLSSSGSAGLSCWVTVTDATAALHRLRKSGIGACAGDPFVTPGRGGDYVKIATTVPHERQVEIALALAG